MGEHVARALVVEVVNVLERVQHGQTLPDELEPPHQRPRQPRQLVRVGGREFAAHSKQVFRLRQTQLRRLLPDGSDLGERGSGRKMGWDSGDEHKRLVQLAQSLNKANIQMNRISKPLPSRGMCLPGSIRSGRPAGWPFP